MIDEQVATSLVPPSHTVSAGSWSAVLYDDEIVDLRHQGVLVLTGVRPVVRDCDWGTAAQQVSRPWRQDQSAAGALFDCTMTSICHGVVVDCELTLRFTDEVTIEARLTPRDDLTTNRTGLVALHPLDLAGTSVSVGHPDGSNSIGALPLHVSPHQPCRNIRSMTWEVGGRTFSVEYAGEVFETEDHRNWTDAGFKTYSRPLERPFPYVVPAGTQIEQRLVVRAGERSTPPRRIQASSRTSDTMPEPATPPMLSTLLDLGTEVPEGLPVDTVVLEIDTRIPNWEELARRSLDSIREAGKLLDLRMIAADPAVCDGLLDLFGRIQLARIGAFDPTTHVTEPRHLSWLSEIRSTTRAPFAVLAGTRAHFAELNRTGGRLREILDGADGITFSITPQMHAVETRHLVSSIAAQRHVVRDAIRIARGKRLHIGPVTLRPRFNAVATTKQDPAARPAGDPRQCTPLAASWLAASVIALSSEGVDSVCYYRVADMDREDVRQVVSWATKARAADQVLVRRSGTLLVATASWARRQSDLVVNLSATPQCLDGDRFAGLARSGPRSTADLPDQLAPWSVGVSSRGRGVSTTD